jgi:hypothetical protein
MMLYTNRDCFGIKSGLSLQEVKDTESDPDLGWFNSGGRVQNGGQ